MKSVVGFHMLVTQRESKLYVWNGIAKYTV